MHVFNPTPLFFLPSRSYSNHCTSSKVQGLGDFVNLAKNLRLRFWWLKMTVDRIGPSRGTMTGHGDISYRQLCKFPWIHWTTNKRQQEWRPAPCKARTSEATTMASPRIGVCLDQDQAPFRRTGILLCHSPDTNPQDEYMRALLGQNDTGDLLRIMFTPGLALDEGGKDAI